MSQLVMPLLVISARSWETPPGSEVARTVRSSDGV
jgi:hypothetical protein